MAAPDISSLSSPRRPSDAKLRRPNSSSSSPQVHDASATAAYEHYLRLPELANLWSSRDFPDWANEPILKPALQALEITFRFVSVALSDPRPYAPHSERRRRLESLAARQIELVAAVCEEERPGGGAPVAELSAAPVGLLTRRRSSQEVWTLPGASGDAVVSRASEASLLPRLAAWEKSEAVAAKIVYQIEGQMQRCPFTLGLGEPNLTGKPVLEYDLVVRPTDLHALTKSPVEPRGAHNRENEALVTIHQILEAWLRAALELLGRIGERIDAKDWESAASDCWILERIWKLLGDIEGLLLLMDPDDFLRLKVQLGIGGAAGSAEAFCFRSAALVAVAGGSRELRRRVPGVLEVEVDPEGGPRVQEAAMRLLQRREDPARVELLQAFQAVEAAAKGFFFGYRQVAAAVVGSPEVGGNRAVLQPAEEGDELGQVILEPPYFPSLDAAKTFLGELWRNQMKSRRY